MIEVHLESLIYSIFIAACIYVLDYRKWLSHNVLANITDDENVLFYQILIESVDQTEERQNRICREQDKTLLVEADGVSLKYKLLRSANELACLCKLNWTKYKL